MGSLKGAVTVSDHQEREYTTGDHSEACRSGMEQELENTESAKMKLQRTKEIIGTEDT